MKRRIGPFTVNPIGYGAMPLSHGYGPVLDDAASERLLHHVLDTGYDFIDTAAIYGLGHNETLIGRALKARWSEFVLASKCGWGPDRVPDGRPAVTLATLEDSLRRLETDHIDLYYLHRYDPRVPIEETVGALARAKESGKIGAIGLSEVSADLLRRAHAAHPIAAVQSEYSLWTRNPEIAVLAACRELGTGFVAFSPVGRGFLAGAVKPGHRYAPGDMRETMPRFSEPHIGPNLDLSARFAKMASERGASPAQLALAWLLHKDDALVAIPGTTSLAHADENMAALELQLDADIMAALDELVNERTVSGGRYGEAMQKAVQTERFASEGADLPRHSGCEPATGTARFGGHRCARSLGQPP